MSDLTPLCEIAFKYGTDKCPQINHTYTPVYYELLKDKQLSIKKVLEIGIGNQTRYHDKGILKYVTGASLYMWRDFFPAAQIYGADNDPATMLSAERIQTFLCEETKTEELHRLIDQVGADVDLVIDDGLHYTSAQYRTCVTLMPLLKKDVIYIIEDIKYPDDLQQRLADAGYECIRPELAAPAKRIKDNVMFIVKPKA